MDTSANLSSGARALLALIALLPSTAQARRAPPTPTPTATRPAPGAGRVGRAKGPNVDGIPAPAVARGTGQSRKCEATELTNPEVEGATLGADDHLGGALCGYGGGGTGAPDAVFEYSAPLTGRYDVRVEGQGFNPLIHVRRTDCEGEFLACAEDTTGGRRPTLALDLVQGDRVAIAVDGTSRGRAGNFVLRITRRRPDLVVRLLSRPAIGLARTRIEMVAEITNVGIADAEPFAVEFVLAEDALLNDPVGAEPVGCPIQTLAAGQSVICRSFNLLSIPTIDAGNYFLGVRVDSTDTNDESNEANNRDVSPLRLARGLIPFQSVYRAADGSAYHVISAAPSDTDGAGSEEVVITTFAASTDSVLVCNAPPGGSPGSTAAAIAGPSPPFSVLHPFTSIVRTGVLLPNDIDQIDFDPRFGGRLTLGSGAGALTVCENTPGCTTTALARPLRPLNVGAGGVPAACIASGVAAPACFGPPLSAFAFSFPGTFNACANSSLVTAQTVLCAPRPADGFTLGPGAAVVLHYTDVFEEAGFSVGVAGLAIDTDGINPVGCPRNSVVGSLARVDSVPPQPIDTSTVAPTLTPTRTPSRTPPPTSSATPTATASQSATPTRTFTRRNTATVTLTPTTTPTNPAVQPASGEIAINATTAGSQQRPDVAMAPDGSCIVAWESEGQDGSGLGVYAQRLSSIGVPVGSEFRVNNATLGDQRLPALAVGANGSFVVVWLGPEPGGASTDVFARRFSSAGAALGDEFVVNTSLAGAQVEADVAVSGDGASAVVWQTPEGPSDSGIAARRYDAGGMPLGDEFFVNTVATFDQVRPRIAAASNLPYAVAWFSSTPTAPDVLLRRVATSGAPLAAEILVAKDGDRPEVALSPTGAALLGWGVTERRVRRYDAASVPLGAATAVGPTLADETRGVAFVADGGFVVLRRERPIVAARFDPSGVQIGAEFRVDLARAFGGAQTIYDAAISGGPNGRFVVVWDSGGQDGSGLGVFARLFRDPR
jgi:hypothetical protein